MQRYPKYILLPLLGLVLLCLQSCSSGVDPAGADARQEITLQQALTDLDSLPTPQNMAAADFDSLREALRGNLQSSGRQRWTSGAPLDASNKVNDFYLSRIDDTTATAHWTYRNIGDYDQNSEVNISDLTGLGANLGAAKGDAAWASARVADGDENAEVNISDITPLGSHLQNKVSAYRIEVSSTPSVEASWLEIGSISFAQGVLPPAGGWISFSLDIAAAAGQSFRVRPLADADEGIPSDPYDYDGTGGPPPMDPAQRQLVLDAIQDKYDNGLSTETSDEQDQELAAFIGAQDGIKEAGYSEGAAWGIFSDGLPVFVFKNREPDMAAPTGKLPARAEPASGSEIRRPSGMPEGNAAALLNSFTADEDHYSPIPQIRDMLDLQHYLSADATGTVAHFEALGDSIAGLLDVLYIDGHGAGADLEDGSQIFVITTCDTWTPALEEQYADDIADGSLAPGLIPTKTGSEFRFCITDRFVAKHGWGLTPDSLVFLNVCSGAGPNKAMLKALSDAGAEHLVGWDSPVGESKAYNGAIEFFAASLGDNRYLDMGGDPDQRPFGYAAVVPAMNARNAAAINITPKYPPPDLAQLRNYDAKVFTGSDNGDGKPGLLAPTIQNIGISDYPSDDPDLTASPDWDILTILGSFDPDGGTVYVGNNAIPENQVLEWSDWLIKVMIPNNIPFSGDVVVEQGMGQVRSNAVALTEWVATFRYSEQYTNDDWSGSLTIGALMEVRFRGCIQKYRVMPWGGVDWHSETGPAVLNSLHHLCTNSFAVGGGDWTGTMTRSYVDENSQQQTSTMTRRTDDTQWDYSLNKFVGTQYAMGGDSSIDLYAGTISLNPWVRFPYTTIIDDTKDGHTETPEAGVVVANAAQVNLPEIYTTNGGEDFGVAGSGIGDHELTVSNGKDHWYKVWWWEDWQVNGKPAPDADR